MDGGSIDIDHLARLAALRLGDGERNDVLSDLQRIVTMVNRMQSVNTDGVAPLAHPLDTTQRLRSDAVTETADRAHLQAGAPAVRDGLYIVPRVVE